MNSTSNKLIRVQELLSGDIDIVSPPEIFLQVSEILDDPTKNAYDAGRIIENDPGLTSRLLKIVNSAIFGFPSKVTSVTRAIAIIGNVELRNLVLATIVVDRFSKIPSEIPSMREFWRKSIRCALFARALTSYHPQCNDASTIFVCGLLHNLGNLVIYSRIPELASQAVILAKTDKISMQDAEQQVMNFDRFDVGGELCKLWRLPNLITKTIMFHNRPMAANIYTQEIAVVTLADYMSTILDSRSENVDIEVIIDHPATEFLAVTPDIIQSIVDIVESEFEEIFQLIYQS